MRRQINLFRSAIPNERGIAEHIETGKSDTAMTQFDRGSAKVERVFTPDEPIKRVHELLHAKFTDTKERWPKISPTTRTFIEDIRLHLTRWPWRTGMTPKVVHDSIKAVCKTELKTLLKELRDNPKADENPLFRGARLGTVMRTLSLPNGSKILRSIKGYEQLLSRGESKVLSQVLTYCSHPDNLGKWRYGALLFDKLVNAPKPNDESMPSLSDPAGTEQMESPPVEGSESVTRIERMQVHEMTRLYNTVAYPISDTQLASAGRTLNWRELVRGKLRRPNRMFIRETEEDGRGGTIVIDASGSMEIDSDKLAAICRLLPAATIAYYFGTDDFEGQMYVYARNGKRADHTPIEGADNSVDGPALKWLLKEPGPRYFVTDIEFCGAGQLSYLAIAHFESCVRNGSIEHINSIDDVLPYFEKQKVAA